MGNQEQYNQNKSEKSYMKIVIDFMEGLGWKIKYLPI